MIKIGRISQVIHFDESEGVGIYQLDTSPIVMAHSDEPLENQKGGDFIFRGEADEDPGLGKYLYAATWERVPYRIPTAPNIITLEEIAEQ